MAIFFLAIAVSTVAHAALPRDILRGPLALAQKAARTPAQRKINSQLLAEVDRRRSDAAQKNVPPASTIVKVDPKDRALVDVRANITPELEKKIRSLGSSVVSTSTEYHSIIAWIPLLKLEQLAEDPAVRAIEPAAEAITNR